MMDVTVREVNLSIANTCNADCLYCPRSFVKKENKFMTLEMVERIMNEITSDEYKKVIPPGQTVLSENGEPFLHPQILDVLRIAKRAGLFIMLFSNFSLIDEEMAEAVISEHLFDAIHVNIDGATAESYKAIKGLDYEKVKKNLTNFINVRNAHNVPMRVFVHVITHYTYRRAVSIRYRRPPIKGDSRYFEQDEKEIMETWKDIINPDYDNIGADSVVLWAERYGSQRDGVFACPNLERIKHCAYINPDGDWYACCFDIGNDLVMGNINEFSIMDIMQSRKRMEFIQKLQARKFNEIGFPCNRVDSCNGVSRAEIG